jgi:hypothetical protein
MNPDIMSFEAFLSRRNNFALHFAGKEGVPHLMGDVYRRNTAFVRCLAEDVEFSVIAAKLRGIADRNLSEERLRELYAAYTHMRTYADTDWELFE